MIDFDTLKSYHPEKYPRHDIGSASLFSTIYKNNICFVPEHRSFFVYSEGVWKRDLSSLQTHELAKEFVVSLIEYFRKFGDSYEDAAKYYARFLSRDKRKKLIDDSASVCAISADQFDRSPVLFNCKNVTVNLATGEAHKHTPSDYLSKMSGVYFDPEADSSFFEKFISDIMEGNTELIAYLQESLGYSISGSSFIECFFLMYGKSTRNGKGTLNNTMLELLGDYAKTATYSTIESKRYASAGGASPEIARLAGSRYVGISEPAESMTIDSALIKTLTGNDKVTARFLYGDTFEFQANFKIWINTNHRISIPDDSVFRSGRVHLIPFNRHFSPEEQDRSLKSKLIEKQNLSGALNWLIKGFQIVAENGNIDIPDIILQEVEAYRESNDRTNEFLNDCFVADMEGKCREKLSRVYKIYDHWCRENNYKPWSKKVFKEKLAEKAKIDMYCKQDCLFGYCVKTDIPSEWIA